MNKTNDKIERVQEIQKETIDDVLNKLRDHHKCLLVRPTGFGKTKSAVDIMRHYKNIVFLYPFNNIKSAIQEYDIEDLNIHLYSYAKLRNMYNKNYELFIKLFSNFNTNDTIFIMDEAHFIGADGTSIVINHLMDLICTKANYLGLTATPNRTDNIEIKWHFFDGITSYEYNIKEAFEDDIYIKPYYVYTPLDGTEIEKMYIKKIDSLSVSKAKKDQLKVSVRKIIDPQKMTIKNLDNIIRNNMSKFKNDIDYYKFILFFSTFNDIHLKKDEIESSFKKVFPDCDINVIIVSSENNRYRLNLNSINNLKARPNTIDLIFNVNMLSFGYHIDDISGIMMFRQTISNIIYTQQVGRCLSVIQDKSTIIFDFVENLYKHGTVIPSDSESYNNKNKFCLLLPENSIELDEQTKELMDIDRLINNTITDEFEEEVINAYKLDLVDIEYCMNKLQLQSENDFYKILRRY